MTYTVDEKTRPALEIFRRFDVDTQLGILWFGYLDIKDQLQPAPPESVEVPGKAVFDQIQALPQQEQLQAQRDLLTGANDIGRGYKQLIPNSRLVVWLLLSKGIENGTIIGVPEDYQLPSETDEFIAQIKQLDFEQRISFLLSAV
ncbi:MAG: orange carotenoid protein N-terminal domain-containing protein [Nostoc sp. SerVER01]|uniref:orange carotenoid protein N-terminal domain-containing protein n=1 Tax=Nostoc sp. CCY 9925 TaxID=3103865 RepID=UPI002AD84BDD|nr:orange carotenoid protein N-terminal domain-containing protein [Nostoc sp. SerVER01]MDZ8023669.1 orange carotenoid protein N-terminal domain-containing protein [Nostoc sp. DedQUE11]MDZ8074011.1 orange carotenoid protein N-terminal domain-containing protein [Nostoc sp. DedQUE01]MDZ8077482.1 orange carotenoid protein N-terminal domain-containing protein [Nostoc sp. DcaGUA01]